MHRDFENESVLESLDFEGVENGREVLSVELNIDDGTNNGFDGSDGSSDFGSVRSSWHNVRSESARRFEEEDAFRATPAFPAWNLLDAVRRR